MMVCCDKGSGHPACSDAPGPGRQACCLHLARPCAGPVPTRASPLWHAANQGCSRAWGVRPGLSPGAGSMSATCGWVLSAERGQGPDRHRQGVWTFRNRAGDHPGQIMLVWSQRHTVPVREEHWFRLIGKLRSSSLPFSPFYLIVQILIFFPPLIRLLLYPIGG